MDRSGTRPAQLAGTWYTGDPGALGKEVDGYIQAAELPEINGEVIGLVAPHAGHRYSGPVAGYAYRAVQGKSYDCVAVLSPFHHGFFEPLLTTSHEAYETPLGTVAVDQDRLAALDAALEKDYQLNLRRLAFDQEHAVEIQLPFLQEALSGEFKLLPVMLASGDEVSALSLGKALGEVLAESNCLLVASTDLSHFYKEEQANRLDEAMLEAIATLDTDKVQAVQRSGKGQACGAFAVLAALTAARKLGANQCQVLKYATSGAASGDYSRVVGYGAAVITG